MDFKLNNPDCACCQKEQIACSDIGTEVHNISDIEASIEITNVGWSPSAPGVACENNDIQLSTIIPNGFDGALACGTVFYPVFQAHWYKAYDVDVPPPDTSPNSRFNIGIAAMCSGVDKLVLLRGILELCAIDSAPLGFPNTRGSRWSSEWQLGGIPIADFLGTTFNLPLIFQHFNAQSFYCHPLFNVGGTSYMKVTFSR